MRDYLRNSVPNNNITRKSDKKKQPIEIFIPKEIVEEKKEINVLNESNQIDFKAIFSKNNFSTNKINRNNSNEQKSSCLKKKNSLNNLIFVPKNTLQEEKKNEMLIESNVCEENEKKLTKNNKNQEENKKIKEINKKNEKKNPEKPINLNYTKGLHYKKKFKNNFKKSNSLEKDKEIIEDEKNNKDFLLKQKEILNTRYNKNASNSLKNRKEEYNKVKFNSVEKEKKYEENIANKSNENIQNNNNDADENSSKNNKNIKKNNFQKKKIAKNPKKTDNFVRLDLKKKYKDKFRGEINNYKTRYTTNGRLKTNTRFNKFKKLEEEKEKKQILETDSEEEVKKSFPTLTISKEANLFLSSLSNALKINLCFDENLDEEIHQKEKLLELVKEIKESPWEVIISEGFLSKILNRIFQHNCFLTGQLEAIQGLLNEQNVLVNSYTGSGKSLVFQFTSFILTSRIVGTSVVVCPTIALCLDHINNLPDSIAGAVYGSLLTYKEKKRVKEMLISNKINVLFICPESLENELLELFSTKVFVPLICIDEAHCISEWSHSFRPAYLRLHEIIFSVFSKSRILALTATANRKTEIYLKELMKIGPIIRSNKVFRENIIITVSRDRDTFGGLVSLLKEWKFRMRGKPTKLIVFCPTIYQVNQYKNFLENSSFNVVAYHSALPKEKLLKIQEEFNESGIGFSMGINISEVLGIIFCGGLRTVEGFIESLGRAARRPGDIGFSHVFLSEEDTLKSRNSTIFEKFSAQRSVYSIISTFFPKDNSSNLVKIESEKFAKEINIKKEIVFALLQKSKEILPDFIEKVCLIMVKCCLRFFKKNGEKAAKGNEFAEFIIANSHKQGGVFSFSALQMATHFNCSYYEFLNKLQVFCKEQNAVFDLENEAFVIFLKNSENFEENWKENLMQRLIDYLEELAKANVLKNDFCYLCLKDVSFPNVEYMIKNGLVCAKENKYVKLAQERLKDYINNYFRSDSIELEDLIKDELLIKFGRPTIALSPTEDENEIFDIKRQVDNFLKIELLTKRNYDNSDIEDIIKDPVKLTSIGFGINSHAVSYKEWKNSSIWESFKNYRFEDIYEIVSETLSNFLYDNNLKFGKKRIKAE